MSQEKNNQFGFSPIKNYKKLKEAKVLLLVVILMAGLALLAFSFLFREYGRYLREGVLINTSSQFKNKEVFTLNVPINIVGGGPNSGIVAGRIIRLGDVNAIINPSSLASEEVFWPEPVQVTGNSYSWLVFSEYGVKESAINQLKLHSNKFILDKIRYKSIKKESEVLYILEISIIILTN